MYGPLSPPPPPPPSVLAARLRAQQKERRERIATTLLAAYAGSAGVRWDLNGPADFQGLAYRAVQMADALIAVLDKEGSHGEVGKEEDG